MAKPSDKHPEMEKFLDETMKNLTGRSRTESIQKNICTFCGKDASLFKDTLSAKEYTISGLCQECQDKTFGP